MGPVSFIAYRGVFRDLARSHGVLFVYNPTSPDSFQYIARFHEQLVRSKWNSLPVVIFSNTPAQPRADSIKGTRESTSHHSDVISNSDLWPFVSDGRDLANTHSIPFIEDSPGHPGPAPFPTLLSLVRQYYEASTSKSFGEGVIDFFTVAAAKVSHVARPHPPASTLAAKEPVEYPPRVQRCKLAASFPAPRCGSFFRPRSWHFPCIPPFRPARNFRQ